MSLGTPLALSLTVFLRELQRRIWPQKARAIPDSVTALVTKSPDPEIKMIGCWFGYNLA